MSGDDVATARREEREGIIRWLRQQQGWYRDSRMYVTAAAYAEAADRLATLPLDATARTEG